METMNATYQQIPPAERHATMVRELAKKGEDIAAYITPQEAHLLHMAVGLMGEVVELFAATDEENFIEECGDIEFYFVGYLQGMNATYGNLLVVNLADYYAKMEMPDIECLLVEAGNLLDKTKKHVIYKKPLSTDDVLPTLSYIAVLLRTLYESMETNRDSILAANLWKLREGPNARYGKQYSDQAAQVRADKPAGE